MSFLDDFLVRTVLASVGVALAAAPLGCFVVWRRMAYFSDATAHAAILGVAIALAFDLSIFAGVLAVSLAMALSVSSLTGRGQAVDTVLGVAAHSALALGLVAASLLTDNRFDLTTYLFGDVLAVSKGELGWIWGGAVLVSLLLLWRWNALLLSTLNPDLAHASGVDPRREQMILTLALAVTVAVAIKVIGALLIGAMLIIPAATARPLARTPESMMVIAALFGVAAAIGGFSLSFELDTQTGPTIVSVAAILFAAVSVTALIGRRVKR
ncbi:metal ABC transporter permease [Pontivivens insulae]|uniref:High-affinity zinc uptake system membrane protein ZnuB n=1 Tax=Pontivivens insulae TaxID=1639689 RepID=A0A2R8AA23_9RHOB|nr:metal ABC transporter permease [Pontivivens insulae]RED12989.1 zinc transport system permease protein [Pontivivens insulae]SPF29082.1 High-affinity zinc uptake system membrane protein ZnuB [Pontivivens insulae]